MGFPGSITYYFRHSAYFVINHSSNWMALDAANCRDFSRNLRAALEWGRRRKCQTLFIPRSTFTYFNRDSKEVLILNKQPDYHANEKRRI